MTVTFLLLRQTYQWWRFSVLKSTGFSYRTACLSPQACRHCSLWMYPTIISAARWGENTVPVVHCVYCTLWCCCFRLQKPNLDVYLQYITLLIHNSVWSYVCMPAIILEGGVLSTRSKLQYLEQALVFLIHVCYNCALRKRVSSDIPEIHLCRLPSQFTLWLRDLLIYPPYSPSVPP